MTYRNNAGKFSDRHAISEDGVEMTFATNYLGIYLYLFLILSLSLSQVSTIYAPPNLFLLLGSFLGHFLLTKLLLEKMAETAKVTGIEGRIVNISSTIHSWFTGDGIQYLDLVTRKKM